MSDRELLEAAAMAAGITGRWGRLLDNGKSLYDDTFFLDHASDWAIDAEKFSQRWDPLTDDGDALRLAVKLGLTIRVDNRAGFSWVKGFEGSQPHEDDPCAATRRAIVRAAAAMASAPQPKET